MDGDSHARDQVSAMPHAGQLLAGGPMTSDRSTDLASTEGENWALSADARRPLPELIEDKLRKLIESGSLKPGDRLPTEPELAAKLDVARSSLRTALQRMQLHGLVEVVRGRGWYIRSEPTHSSTVATDFLDQQRFTDQALLEVRMALETTAAALAALRADAGELDDIAKLSAAYKHANGTDLDELLSIDEEFHAAIVRASHNEVLEQLSAALAPQTRQCRRATYRGPEVHTRSAHEHQQVVMWLRRRDEFGARTAMTVHLLGVYTDVVAGNLGTHTESPATLTTYMGVDEDGWADSSERPVT